MRLIDADALIDKTDDRYSLHEIGRRERDDIVDALEYAPTIQPEPHWIPVMEEPKKEEKSYWVCLEDGGQCQCRWTNDVYGIGIEEIKKQYDLNIIPSTFMDKFGEYLV